MVRSSTLSPLLPGHTTEHLSPILLSLHLFRLVNFAVKRKSLVDYSLAKSFGGAPQVETKRPQKMSLLPTLTNNTTSPIFPYLVVTFSSRLIPYPGCLSKTHTARFQFSSPSKDLHLWTSTNLFRIFRTRCRHHSCDNNSRIYNSRMWGLCVWGGRLISSVVFFCLEVQVWG